MKFFYFLFFSIFFPTNQADVLLTKAKEIWDYVPILFININMVIMIFIVASIILSNNIIKYFTTCNKRYRLSITIAAFCCMIACHTFLKVKIIWMQRKIRLIIPVLPIKLTRSVGSHLLRLFFLVFVLTLLSRMIYFIIQSIGVTDKKLNNICVNRQTK